MQIAEKFFRKTTRFSMVILGSIIAMLYGCADDDGTASVDTVFAWDCTSPRSLAIKDSNSCVSYHNVYIGDSYDTANFSCGADFNLTLSGIVSGGKSYYQFRCKS